MTGDELKKRREFMNLTQAELARKFFVSAQTISNYENERSPVPKTFEMALKALELEER
jgi:transcriptional regulator with XRE-family HTH domain